MRIHVPFLVHFVLLATFMFLNGSCCFTKASPSARSINRRSTMASDADEVTSIPAFTTKESQLDEPTIIDISLLAELEGIGTNNQTVCPFQVRNRVKDISGSRAMEDGQDRPRLIVQYVEIVCQGRCKQCIRLTGFPCLQIRSHIKITVLYPGSDDDRNEEIILGDVRQGCVCAGLTPEDALGRPAIIVPS